MDEHGHSSVLFQGLKDSLVGGPHFVVHFDHFPADYSLLVDHVSRRMRPATAGRIQKPVAVNDFVPAIGQERKLGKFLIILRNAIDHFLKISPQEIFYCFAIGTVALLIWLSNRRIMGEKAYVWQG